MSALHRITRLFVIFSALVCGVVHAQFISLHQFPLTYVTSSGVDAQGSYFSRTSDPLMGFKNQYAPTGVSGCALGYPEYRSLCQSPSGGLSFNFTGYSDFNQFRVYVPAGTTFFSVTGNLPQNSQYAVAVRMDSAPVRTAALSDAEYETHRGSQDIYSSYGRLMNGEELVMVHNYGGNISLAGEARFSSAPTTTGRWIYFRVLNGSSLYLLGAIYEINRDLYAQGYASTTFGADGDPVASSGTNPTPNPNPDNPSTTLTGITLSVAELTVGATANGVTIRPVPTTASMPSCTASPAGLMQADSIVASLTPNAPVWLLNSTAAAALTGATTVTFTCGGQSASLIVSPAGFATTISTEVVTNPTTAAVTLRVTLTRGTAEVAAGGSVDYWVGGMLPINAMFFTSDQWFFLATNAATNVAGWTQLTLPNPASVAYKRGVTPASATDVVEIPLGFSRAEAAPFKVQVHFGYKSGTGNFRNMGKIWDSTSSN